jgi:biotin carboxyl carrier protein
MKKELIVDGEMLEFDFSRSELGFRVHLPDGDCDVIPVELPDGRTVCIVDGVVIELAPGDRENIRIARKGPRTNIVEVEDPRQIRRKSTIGLAEGSAEIRTSMPGKIVNILVENEQLVEANQGIIVMEAMKMENELRTPVAGKVRLLGIEQGQAVDSGFVVAVVEAADTSS